MVDAENILTDNELFVDTADTPKEEFEQHRKRECLNGAIRRKSTGWQKQWTQERVDKLATKYKQRELNQKPLKTG